MPILTNEMMRSIIYDHSSNPQNKREPNDDTYEKIHMHSDNCIDDIDVYLKMMDNKVVDACFTGIGCTISTASTDIICDLMIGKNREEADYILKQYDNMLHEEHYDEDALEEANAFSQTSKQAARIRCATIGSRALEELLKDK